MSKSVIINIILDNNNVNNKNVCEKKEKRTTMNTKFRAIVNYLIGFFYTTEKKYSCSVTKIGKLLSILAFKEYVENGKYILGESVIVKKYKACGTYIPKLFMYSDISSNIYINAETITTETIYNAISSSNSTSDAIEITTKDTNEHITDFIEYEDTYIPSKYKISEDILTEEEKSKIQTVFLEYGAFSPDLLGEIIGDFCTKAGVFDSENNVDFSILKKYRYANDDEVIAKFIGCTRIE